MAKKRKTKVAHTPRTMKALRERGLVPAMVEKWNPHVRRPDGGMGVRQDLFSIIDIIALDQLNGQIIGVQSTGQDFSGHRRKLLIDYRENTALWLQCGGALELYAWRKVKARGADGKRTKREIWEPRIHVFSLDEVGLFM